MKGNKTDRKDAKWICDLCLCGMVKPSFIAPADIRELRVLVRYRFKLTCMVTSEKNRAQNCLTVSNLKLDDVFSDVFGKSIPFYYRTDFATPRRKNLMWHLSLMVVVKLQLKKYRWLLMVPFYNLYLITHISLFCKRCLLLLFYQLAFMLLKKIHSRLKIL